MHIAVTAEFREFVFVVHTIVDMRLDMTCVVITFVQYLCDLVVLTQTIYSGKYTMDFVAWIITFQAVKI